MGSGETNQRSWDICNLARHLISELLLVGNQQGEKKKGRERIKNEIKIFHIGYSDKAIEVKGI